MTSTDLTIGFARLSDCASLVAAKERGEFEKQGLNVTLKRYASWAAMRDALAHGVIDAAQMLAPMVVGSAAGLGPYPGAFSTSFSINLNGNAITVSNTLYETIKALDPNSLIQRPLLPSALKTIAAKRRECGEDPLTFAHVYHYSMHGYELRYWLAAAGLEPDSDVKLVVVAPEQMVTSLENGLIDGYCVGEPWNSAAIDANLGKTLITSSEIWSNAPEKVLAVRKNWSQQNVETHVAIIKAMLKASQWIDRPDNRLTAAQIVSRPEYVDMPLDIVQPSLTGKGVHTGGDLIENMPDFNVFHRYSANYPWRSHAKWIFSQMVRWGEALSGTDADGVAEAAYNPELYRTAADELGIAYPNVDEKLEGAHTHAWLQENASSPIAMGPDTFMDGKIFNPSISGQTGEKIQVMSDFVSAKRAG